MQVKQISSRLTKLCYTMGIYESRQQKNGEYLINLQKQLKRLECGFFKLGLESWNEAQSIANYNRIDEVKLLIQETCQQMGEIDKQLKQMKMEIRYLFKKLRQQYKTVALRV